MLYKRYANPLSLLATFDSQGLVDFILYIFEQENEEMLWEIWVNKDIEENFDDFKKSKLKKLRAGSAKNITQDEINSNIVNASQFINTKKGG